MHDMPLLQREKTDWLSGTKQLALCVPERGHELLDLAVDLNPRKPSSLQRYIVGRFEGVKGPEWLDMQRVDQAARATEMLGVHLVFGRSPNLNELKPDDWDRAAEVGYAVTSAGVPGIRDCLGQIQKDAWQSEKIPGQSGPQMVFGRLYQWLAFSKNRKDPGPIKDVVRDYIFETMPVEPGKAIFGVRLDARRLHTIGSLSATTGIHYKTLRNMLAAKGLFDGKVTGNSANFDASSAEAAALLIKTSLQRSELPAFMNTTRGQIIMLIEAGYLKKNSETGKTKASYAGAVSRESAVVFLNALHASAVEVHDIPDGFMNIPSAAQKSRVTCPRIIELILEGGLKSVVRVSGIEGYSSIHVSPTELIEQANLVPKEKPITVFRARNLIGLTQQAMSFLISDAAGEDRIIVTPGSIGRPATVSKDEVICFSERFMTLFQLCKITGRHHILLNREVQSAGVKPAFNPAMIGTTIFRRQDLRPWLGVPAP